MSRLKLVEISMGNDLILADAWIKRRARKRYGDPIPNADVAWIIMVARMPEFLRFDRSFKLLDGKTSVSRFEGIFTRSPDEMVELIVWARAKISQQATKKKGLARGLTGVFRNEKISVLAARLNETYGGRTWTDWEDAVESARTADLKSVKRWKKNAGSKV